MAYVVTSALGQKSHLSMINVRTRYQTNTLKIIGKTHPGYKCTPICIDGKTHAQIVLMFLKICLQEFDHM